MPLNVTGPPEPVLYRLMFQAAGAMESGARKREAASQDSQALRQYFARHGGLSAGENAVLFQVAAEHAAAEANDIAQQKKLIADWRAQRRAFALGQGPAPTTPISALQQLQADRDAIAMQSRERLHLLLGENGFNRLEAYLHREFGRAQHKTLPLPLGTATSAGGAQ